MMNFDEIKKYWDDRAAVDNSAQSTTQDYYMRDIEFRVIRDMVDKYSPANVLDIGCGDARTTARLAAEFDRVQFVGVDYSKSMVRNAQIVIDRAGIDNLSVMLCDVSQSLPLGQLEMIYSTRCLINLPTWELQRTAIKNIADALLGSGLYVMIENFTDGHDSFNRIRHDFGLPEIAVREHNLYLNHALLVDFISNYFQLLHSVNISSSYYLVSRIIYSKICQEKGVSPDYFDVHHEYASRLPFCGDFGPIRMICLRKK